MKRMLPGTRALRTFEAAARHLNFTRAAAEVGLTAAAVSYQIREIEEQLGVTLFARTSRSIRLTDAGAILYEATGSALGLLHRAVAEARRSEGKDAPLRLTLGPRFATNWLFPRLPRLKAACPDLALSFDVTDELRDVAAGAADAAIRFGGGAYGGTSALHLFGTEIVAVCAPALARAHAWRTPADLADHTLCHVVCETAGVAWPGWRDWMAAAGVAGFDDRRCIAFTESSHVVQAATDGGAIALAELPMIGKELAEGRLVRLFDVGIPVGGRFARDFAYYFVYPDGAAADERIAALRHWLHTETADTPPAAPRSMAEDAAAALR